MRKRWYVHMPLLATAQVDNEPLCYPTARKVKLQSTTGDPLHFFEFQVISLDENVALNKNATQSSTYITKSRAGAMLYPQFASYAIDNDPNTFCYTDCTTENAWWMVDLYQMYPIKSVSIMNRWCQDDVYDQDGCLCRLSDASLTLLDEDGGVTVEETLHKTCDALILDIEFPSHSQYCMETESPTAYHSVSPRIDTDSSSPCPQARYIKVLQNTTAEQLYLSEVQVFSSGSNVAVGKNSSQASTFVGNGTMTPRYAFHAVDGDLTTYSQTDCVNPWWIVDLGWPMPIQNVTIINHLCRDESDEAGCLCRLSHAMMLLLDDNESIISSSSFGDTCGQNELVFEFCNGTSPTLSSYGKPDSDT